MFFTPAPAGKGGSDMAFREFENKATMEASIVDVAATNSDIP
jgi:hypothetical protein